MCRAVNVEIPVRTALVVTDLSTHSLGEDFGASAGEQAQTPEETARMESLALRSRRYLRATVILLFVAVVMMAAARYA